MRNYKLWTNEEIKFLKENHSKLSQKELSKQLNRSIKSIEKQVDNLGIGFKRLGKNNNMWKGDKITYSGVHAWVKAHKSKPLYCERCNKKKKLDLANKSGKYLRDINDYEWICRKCHVKSDKRLCMLRDFSKKYGFKKGNPYRFVPKILTETKVANLEMQDSKIKEV